MKKKVLISIGVIIVIAVAVVLLVLINAGEKPFKNLSAEDISEISIWLQPPNEVINLNRNEIDELVGLLQDIVIYKEDNTYGGYNGQIVMINIVKTDGTQLELMAYNPFFVIAGQGYTTKYRPCEAVNRYANEILGKRK